MKEDTVCKGGAIGTGGHTPASMPTRRALIVKFALFQCAWFAAVLGAAHGQPLLGTACVFAAIAFHVTVAARPAVEFRFIVVVCAAGFIAESIVAMQGHITYPSGQPVAWLAPYWIVALWGLLATAPNVTLRWLKRRPAVAALLGAALGPMAFVAGARLGGARLVNPPTALITMALMWAVLMPALMWVSTVLDGIAAHTPARDRAL